MVPSVSSTLPTAPTAAAAPAAKTASAPAAEPVTVQISSQAQVKQLDASGSTVPEIVLKTGLDTATVKLYLNE